MDTYMRKPMLPYILATLAMLIVAFAIIVSNRPATFRVERSITMSVPASAPFTEVNDFHNWQVWSPYVEFDPNMTTTYAGPESGVGAEMAWSGNSKAGQGRMTIVKSQPTELVRMNLEFTKPFAATNTAEFTFRSEGENTVVTWTMTGNNNFMSKAVQLFMNMDKLVGGDFERGLAKMKTVSEKQSRVD
jgi:hypothetical protein